ncbi:MAG: TetR/AcrR family transcriptional regulator C-terminal domain-containing protein [Microthrixaceae bacterium]
MNPPRERAEQQEARRAPLSRDAVLRTAVRMADESGIGSISMRKLGEALGVEAMSLYNHVSNKEDLLDGMVDSVFAELAVSEPEEHWRSAMEHRARSAREALGRHRWAIALMDSRTAPGPATMRHQDSIIGCLRANGFSIELTAHAIAALDAFVYGFALQEAALPFENQQEAAALAGDLMEQLGSEYPHFAEFATRHVMQPGYDFGEEFEFGLGLVLDGIARHSGEDPGTSPSASR